MNVINENRIEQFTLNLVVTNRAAREIQEIALMNNRQRSVLDLDDYELREKAEFWLKDHLIEEDYYRVYVFNEGPGKEDGHMIDIHFATDTENIANQDLSNKLNNRTLILFGTEKIEGYFSEPKFLLIGVKTLPLSTGSFDPKLCKPADIKFNSYGKNLGIPKLFSEKLLELPESHDHRKIVQRRLDDWKAYLNILMKQTKSRKFEVQYSHYRNIKSDNKISFTLIQSQSPIPWDRIKRARNDFIDVRPSKNEDKGSYGNFEDFFDEEEDNDWRLGNLANLKPESGELIVELDEDLAEEIFIGKRALPKTGTLIYKAMGDEIFIDRMNKGIDTLSRRQSVNVNLSEFLFDPNEAKEIETENELKVQKNQLLQPHLFDNEQQRKAVEGALNSPDIFLIQGPPGTGKTTVIAEICYQIALNGGRTMIASQANLAVDNAMSRLVHNPSIRALRRGRAERVEEEGKPYLEKNVITTWLKQTAESCKENLNDINQEIQNLISLVEFTESCSDSINEVYAFCKKNKNAKEKEQKINQEIISIKENIKISEQELSGFQKTLNNLKEIESSTKKHVQIDKELFKNIDKEIPYLQNPQNKTIINEVIDINKKIYSEMKFWIDIYEFSENDLSEISLTKQLLIVEIFYLNFQKINTMYWKQRFYIDQLFGRIYELYELNNNLVGYKLKKGYLLNQNKLIDVYLNFSAPNFEFHKQETNISKINLIQEQSNYFEKMINIYSNSLKLKPNIHKKVNELEILISQLEEKNNLIRKQIIWILNQINGLNPFDFLKDSIQWVFSGQLDEKLLWINKWNDEIKNTDIKFMELVKYFQSPENSPAFTFLGNLITKHIDFRKNLIEKFQEDLRKKNKIFEELLSRKESIKNDDEILINKWQKRIQNLPEHLKIYRFEDFPYDYEIINNFINESNTLKKTLSEKKDLFIRTERIVRDWILRIEQGDYLDIQGLRNIYINNANVIGITCGQAGARHFSDEYRDFDCVIVDEVSKATPPELILPILKGKKIILVGDHKQLPPMIGQETFSELADQFSLSDSDLDHIKRSLFKELFNKCPNSLKTTLTIQYRMHPQIMQAINQFYNNELILGIENPDISRAHKLDFIFPPENHIIWVSTPNDVENQEIKDGTTFYNLQELRIIEKIVQKIDDAWEKQISMGEKPKEIGIITFYSSQNAKIKELLLNRSKGKEFNNLNIRVGTVDRFQGMEKPIIIASLVRNNNQGDIGFAKEPERINVAFSRAQELLIIIGCSKLFSDNARNKLATDIYSRVLRIAKLSGGLRDSFTYFNERPDEHSKPLLIDKKDWSVKVAEPAEDQSEFPQDLTKIKKIEGVEERFNKIKLTNNSLQKINAGYQLLLDTIAQYDSPNDNNSNRLILSTVRKVSKELGIPEKKVDGPLKYGVFVLRDKVIHSNYQPTSKELENYIRAVGATLRRLGYEIHVED